MEVRIGGSYRHEGKYVSHGNCIVIGENRLGFKIQVWGGPNGDKVYTFSGIKHAELKERSK